MHERTGEWCIRGQVRDASEDRWVMHQRTGEGCIKGQISDASEDRWGIHQRTGEWCIKGQMSNASEDSWGMHQRTDDWCIRGQVRDASNNRMWHAVRVSVVTGLFVLHYYLWLELMMNHYGSYGWASWNNQRRSASHQHPWCYESSSRHSFFLSYRSRMDSRYVSVPRDASWITHGS